MGKKKGKDGKDEFAYKTITLEEVRARELKYLHRVEALKACLSYLDDILEQMEQLNEENRLLENWNAYLSCDGLPKPYLPSDIRLFFEKLRHFETESVERNIDWPLSVDNRSILTQNIYRIDKTRENVKREMLPNFGEFYDNNINLALQVLKSIEYYLVDEKMKSKAPPRILQDIIDQKSSVHQEINGFLDRYAYRVLCSEEAYMDDIDARTAEYFYNGTNFLIHIWTIKNVPILFEFLDDPFMVANFHCLKVKVHIPFSILEDNLTVRGMHFDFDHFSEYAKSFEQAVMIPLENLNAGITDLRDCLLNEWNMQVELQMHIRSLMVSRRLDYEEKKKQFDEEEAQRAKEKKNKDDDDKKKKKVKTIKLPKEPPIVSENHVPDTWEDFLKSEQGQFEDFLNFIYHPNLLKLEPHEINLKKFLLLGGIYQFDFVAKARHFDFASFNMTWHENNSKLFIKSNSKIETPEAERPARSFSSRAASVASVESTYDPNDSPYFIVRMELPEYLCLWGTPLPCHFEADVIGYVEEDKEEEIPVPIPTKKQKKSVANVTPPTLMNTNEEKNALSRARGSVLSFSSMVERHASITRLPSIIPTEISAYEWDQLAVEDFDLSFILTKPQIRNLARHCIPRIISSYKFPSEFTAEARERSAKAKSAGGTLIRRHSNTAGDDRGSDMPATKDEVVFSTLMQHEPERLFPLFPTPETLNMKSYIIEQDDDPAPKTFFGLIKRLDHIKRYYIGRVQRTAKLPPFKPKIKLLQPKVGKRVSSPPEMQNERPRRSSKGLSVHGSVASFGVKRTSTDKHKKSIDEKAQNSINDNEPEGEVEEEQEIAAGTSSTVAVISEVVDTRKTYKFSRWTTKYIKHSEFDREKRIITIWTDRLGVFGLAYKRYEQLPFRYWCLEPSEENPDNEVVFTLETQYAKVVLYVTGDGVRGYVTDLQKKFVRNRPMYLVIDEPLKDFRELRKRFRDKNLNIFTERDASFYIENGYFSQKHLATELHTYCCMCTHALLMRFLYSEWNRLASRRNMILRCVHHKESEEYMCTVRITPEESTFVTIKELCSDDLNVFNLEYTLTWRNIDFYADLHHLITSMYPSAPDQRIKNPHLIYFLKALLWEVRPLSFS